MYVLKNHPIGHKNVVCQDRWSLVTGSVILKFRFFCQNVWSIKTGGLSWQWSLKIGFTVHCTCCIASCFVWVRKSTTVCIVMIMGTPTRQEVACEKNRKKRTLLLCLTWFASLVGKPLSGSPSGKIRVINLDKEGPGKFAILVSARFDVRQGLAMFGVTELVCGMLNMLKT